MEEQQGLVPEIPSANSCVEGGEHVEKITLVKPLLGTSLVGPMANTLVLLMLGAQV